MRDQPRADPVVDSLTDGQLDGCRDVALESYGSTHLLHPAGPDREDDRDEDLRRLLGSTHNAVVCYLRFRGVRQWDGWVVLMWAIEIEEAERAHEPKGARYYHNTVRYPLSETLYRIIRLDVRQERGRYMCRVPRKDEDLWDLNGPHYADGTLWARIEWPNAGRSAGHWTLAGLPFTGERPSKAALNRWNQQLQTVFDIVQATEHLGRPARPRDTVLFELAEAAADIWHKTYYEDKTVNVPRIAEWLKKSEETIASRMARTNPPILIDHVLTLARAIYREKYPNALA